MDIQERCALGLAVIKAEQEKDVAQLATLSRAVLDEVFRLEQAGESTEAHAFEVFIPIDENYLNFLAPLVGDDELETVLKTFNATKKEERRCYFVERDYRVDL